MSVEKVHKSHKNCWFWQGWTPLPPSIQGKSKALTSCAKVKLGQEFAGLNFLNRGKKKFGMGNDTLVNYELWQLWQICRCVGLKTTDVSGMGMMTQ